MGSGLGSVETRKRQLIPQQILHLRPENIRRFRAILLRRVWFGIVHSVVSVAAFFAASRSASACAFFL
jgi:hypothetical protein